MHTTTTMIVCCLRSVLPFFSFSIYTTAKIICRTVILYSSFYAPKRTVLQICARGFTWCRLIALRRVSSAVCEYLFYHLVDRHHRIRTCFFFFFFICCFWCVLFSFVFDGDCHIFLWFVTCSACYQSAAWKYENKRQITTNGRSAPRRNPIEFTHKYYEYFSLFIDLCVCVCTSSHYGGLHCRIKSWSERMLFVILDDMCTRISYVLSDAATHLSSHALYYCETWAVSEWYANCKHEWRTRRTNNTTERTVMTMQAMEYATFIGCIDEHETM